MQIIPGQGLPLRGFGFSNRVYPNNKVRLYRDPNTRASFWGNPFPLHCGNILLILSGVMRIAKECLHGSYSAVIRFRREQY